jgi:soluble lytic murein transglycosylase-like protein
MEQNVKRTMQLVDNGRQGINALADRARNTGTRLRRMRLGPGMGADLGSLARNRPVQGVLVAAALFHGIGVAGQVAHERGVEAEMLAAQAADTLPAAAALTPEQNPEVRELWLARAMERDAESFVQRFRGQGYSLTPTLAKSIQRAAREFDIDPEVAFGLVRAESSFRNQATSPVGAVGLTQLMPRTAAWMEPGVTRAQLRDPDTNLRIGFKYLRYLLDKYDGNENLALLAYNRGPGTVDRALRSGRNPDNGYAAFVRGEKNHGHTLYTRNSRR